MTFRITIVLETSTNPFPTEQDKIDGAEELRATFPDLITGECSIAVEEVKDRATEGLIVDGHPHPIIANEHEFEFIAGIMKTGSDAVFARISEMMSSATYDVFTPEEKDLLEQAYHGWNGDPEAFIPGYFCPQASVWLSYYASVFKAMAKMCQ